jgi:hypothetical protein
LKQKEKIMNTQDENQDVVRSSAYNPFPEPQTIPAGWDTSVFSSASQPFDLAQDKPVSATEEDNSTES